MFSVSDLSLILDLIEPFCEVVGPLEQHFDISTLYEKDLFMSENVDENRNIVIKLGIPVIKERTYHV